ncbi:glycerol-3-phosphate dehydrogenase subunit B [Propionibacterium cyclohexanicum]|uniref:Glycerol-3-phosphate dehydrogenase subunit B n=1 Tax=Propionibacterium cyclohexanicum TaxID=64702 RepID=A0A1H9QR58_9ACTN|nr:glycerol-3-phosphate dehydrogenase subunit GlpB [Propionibacterium cyclohexanicum]SER62705.1 glycerol-3-phosphate dehydrogenase subunit B [Propionibacterium cyclohexanicum]
MRDVVVVGAGLTGLVASIRLRRAGLEVTLVHQGIGGLQLGQGTIDVLGYRPERVARPLDELADFLAAQERQGGPSHPYAVTGPEAITEGVGFLSQLVGPQLLVGDVHTNVALPTAIGALRPTSLYQPSMADGLVSLDPAEPGALHAGCRVVVVGIDELKDFPAQLIAGNLAATDLPDGGRLSTRAAQVSFPARGSEVDSTGLNIARALDDPARRSEFARVLSAVVEPGETVALPAVLGIEDARAFPELRAQLGTALFEIPLPPPGVPGMRINEKLTRIARAERVEIISGSALTGITAEADRVSEVIVATSGHDTHIPARAVLLAPGGFESGALRLDSYQQLSEPILDLPVARPSGELINDSWAREQPLFRAGLATDTDMVVLDPRTGGPVHRNLHAAGGILAGAQRWDEKSGEGIALASAMRACEAIVARCEEKDHD